MKKISLTSDDLALVQAAIDAANEKIIQIEGVRQTPQVASALRMDDGRIITAQNLIADVGSISMCAEPQAIAQANRHTDKKAVAIVAVYHLPGHPPQVIPPCGRCREVITDFIAGGYVILRDPGTKDLYKTPVGDLLPLKYADYWKEGSLI